MAALPVLNITSQPEKEVCTVRGVGCSWAAVPIRCDNTAMQELRSNSGKDWRK